MVCKYDAYQGYLYLSFAGVWVVYIIWWGLNAWFFNARYTRSLQKLIFFVLLFKTLYIGFHGGSKILCYTAEDEAYWGLATTATFTLYNTFLYTVMALISKGFCLIRETLSRTEVTSVAVIMGLVYLGFSAYLIEPTSIAPVLIGLIGLLFLNCSKSSIQNLKLMQIRYYNLQQANILPLLPELAYKVRIMKWFIFLSYIFYVNELIKVALICVGMTLKLEIHDSLYVYESSVELSLGTISCFSIFFLFRPKERMIEFNSSISFQHMPLIIAPILTASVPFNECEVRFDKPLLVCVHGGNSEGKL